MDENDVVSRVAFACESGSASLDSAEEGLRRDTVDSSSGEEGLDVRHWLMGQGWWESVTGSDTRTCGVGWARIPPDGVVRILG